MTLTIHMLLFSSHIAMLAIRTASVLQRRVLTKFRIIAHNLQIEKGRYIGVKTKDIICTLCNTRVEDETHFLLLIIKYYYSYFLFFNLS
jgi:hypothetical protein